MLYLILQSELNRDLFRSIGNLWYNFLKIQMIIEGERTNESVI